MNELLKRLWAAQSRAERPPGGELDTVYMHGIITDETTQDEYRRYFNDDRTISVISVLKQLSEIRGDTVRLNINSPGGNYFEGAAIRDTLLADGRELVAVGAGMVGSAATLPFFAAGRRELADGGMIMIHQPASGVYEMGTADEIEKAAMAVVRGLRAMSVTVAQIYSTATGGKTKAKRFGELMTAETMFSPQEALELGLVQSVITPNQPTNKEGDMEKTKLIATLGLPDDVSDEDLETAVAAMKQRDDQAQANQQTNDATAAFDTAMSVPLAQGKVTPDDGGNAARAVRQGRKSGGVFGGAESDAAGAAGQLGLFGQACRFRARSDWRRWGSGKQGRRGRRGWPDCSRPGAGR